MSDGDDQGLSGAQRAFRSHYEQGTPFVEDRQLAGDLCAEAAPALRVLLADPQRSDPPHDAYALIHLLGRRAGLLGATPTAALVVGQGLVEAVAQHGQTLSVRQRHALVSVVLEGYAAGRDERLSGAFRDRLFAAQVWLELAPGCYGVFLSPLDDDGRLEALLAEIERVFFRAGVRGCVLDLSRCDAGAEEARHIAGFCATCAGLGVRVFVVCERESLQSQLRELGIERWATPAADFRTAFGAALAAAGWALRPKHALRALLGRLALTSSRTSS